MSLTKHIWNFPLNLALGNRINDDSPLWNSASGEQHDLGRGDIPRGKGRQDKENKKLEARNPKYETNYNDGNTNVQNS